MRDKKSKVEQLSYRNRVIRIVPGEKKGKEVFWIQIDGRDIDFVSCPITARRIAVKFLDVVLGEEFQVSGKHEAYGVHKHESIYEYRLKYDN